jgi:hypothetical protein
LYAGFCDPDGNTWTLQQTADSTPAADSTPDSGSG